MPVESPERIIVLEQDAEEAEPCEVTGGCSREAVFLVTFVFPGEHHCDIANPARLCLPHTDFIKALHADGELICLLCQLRPVELKTSPIRRPLCPK